VAQQDYFSGAGSKFGQLAGSILSSKRKRKKKDAITALALSAFVETLGAKNQQLQQGLADSMVELKDRYTDIFSNQDELWGDWINHNKKQIDDYDKYGSSYLNEQAEKRINDSDEVIESGVTWEKRNDPTVSKEARDALFTAFNAERKRVKSELDIIRNDPRAQFETKIAFNQKTKEAYLKELALIKDDPTQKGVLRNLFNRIFRTERDKKGNLVSTNAEKIELQEALKKAVVARDKQNNDIQTAIDALDGVYAGIVGKKVNNSGDIEDLQNNAVIRSRKGFTEQQIDTHIIGMKDTFFEKDPDNPGQYKEGIHPNLKNANIIVNVTNKQKGLQKGNDPATGKPYEYPIEQVKLFKNNLKNLKVQNSEGEIDPLTTEKFFRSLAITEMVLNGSLIKTGKDALTGTILTAAALDLWSKEGRFSKLVGETEDIRFRRDRVIWDKNDILVTLPTNDGYNLVNNTIQTSDAASLNQEQGAGNSNELIPDDTDEEGVKKYDRQDIISYANSTEGIDGKTGLPVPKNAIFANMSKEGQDSEIARFISTYPEREKEIINIFSNSEYRKSQKRKQVVIDTSSQTEPTVTRRGIEYTAGGEIDEEALEAIKKQIKTPFVKTRIERLAKAINTGKYGAVGSLLAKQTGEPYRTLTKEERKIAAQAIIDELLKDIG
jgi:uncharacterized protein YozE (UPF0346 family)